MYKLLLALTLTLALALACSNPSKPENINTHVTPQDLIGYWYPVSYTITEYDSSGSVIKVESDDYRYQGDTLVFLTKFTEDSVVNYSIDDGYNVVIDGNTYTTRYGGGNEYYSIYHGYYLDGFDSTFTGFQELFTQYAGKDDDLAAIQIRDNVHLEIYYHEFFTGGSTKYQYFYERTDEGILPPTWPYGVVYRP